MLIPIVTPKVIKVATESTDLYPTLFSLAGIKINDEEVIDRVSLLPLINGQREIKQRSLAWHYPHHHGSASIPASSIRQGDW